MFETTVPWDPTDSPIASDPDPATAWGQLAGPLDSSWAALPNLQASTFCSSLSSTLLSDLGRFIDHPGGADLLAVVAAAVRHVRPLGLELTHRGDPVYLSVFPREGLFQCVDDLMHWPAAELRKLRLLHVEPEAELGESPPSPAAAPGLGMGALGPLLWRLALQGALSDLLPEIAGPARYRLAPCAALSGLPLDPALHPVIAHMRARPASLAELTELSRCSRPQVRRLLNAIYLQSGLMITRGVSLG
jgi:hypothetical protein